MPGLSLTCPQCRAPLGAAESASGVFHPCPGCAAPTRVRLYPAALRALAAGAAAEPLVVESEAACFYHPQKRAAVHCQGCGRFLCSLCDVQIGLEHLCPGCLDARRAQGSQAELVRQRPLYDSAALMIALVPLLLWPLTFITAPAAIAVALYGWSKPGSLVRGSRIRLLLAIGFSLLQILGWTLAIAAILRGAF